MNILAQMFSDEFKTDIPLVYTAKPVKIVKNKPLWISIIGPSGAGKDSIKDYLLRTNRFHYIKTATNRRRRKDEDRSAYIWMRKQLENEPLHSYLRNVVKEYGLFEYNYHYGNMYGTPLDSIKNALKSNKIALYLSDNNGVQFIENQLSEIFNIVTINVIPDSLKDMERRIRRGQRNNPTRRMAESIQKIRTARNDANYILRNPGESIEHGKSGLESAANSLKRLIAKLESQLC